MRSEVRGGQVGLMLLVIIGVVVALVMSVASRSLSDTVLSRQERESSVAFSLAETGIENALNDLRKNEVSPGVVELSGMSGFVTGNYTVKNEASYALYVKEGETAHLDLGGFSGTLSIYWTKKGDVSENITPAAVELNAVNTGANVVMRSYYNPYNSVPEDNKFSTSSSGGSEYLSLVEYDVPVGAAYLRIRPVYAGATLMVTGSNLLTQLYLIQSSAAGGDAQKEIEVKRGLDAPPSVFDYAIFSAGAISKVK
ncbi:MAG: hypothetical protein ABII21_03595 [bacterium]